MSIEALREDVREITQLHLHIKTREKELRALKQQYKRCEKRIIESLEHRDEPGAMFEGTTVLLKEVHRRSYVSKSAKYERAQEYIDTYGAPLNQSDMDEFLEAMRGEQHKEYTLKVFVQGFD